MQLNRISLRGSIDGIFHRLLVFFAIFAVGQQLAEAWIPSSSSSWTSARIGSLQPSSTLRPIINHATSGGNGINRDTSLYLMNPNGIYDTFVSTAISTTASPTNIVSGIANLMSDSYSEIYTTTPLLAADYTAWEDSVFSTAPPVLLLFVALLIGIVANGWIQRLLSGESGLGAFLSDGSGYSKSGFKFVQENEDRAVSSDPLPWLKLPQLDFVDVAGQENKKQEDVFETRGGIIQNINYPVDGPARQSQKKEKDLLIELERLRLEMTFKLDEGNTKEAEMIRQKLEKLLKESGMEFKTD